LIERVLDKKRWSHKQGALGIHQKDLKNPWFRALYRQTHELTTHPALITDKESNHGWGGCPPEVHQALTQFTAIGL
jgi:hypothetical protein